MDNLRIVHNARTGKFRIERRRLWGWSFIMNDAGDDYLTFEKFDDAQDHLCARNRPSPAGDRRWEVVPACCD
jgi:hypothetical protein